MNSLLVNLTIGIGGVLLFQCLSILYIVLTTTKEIPEWASIRLHFTNPSGAPLVLLYVSLYYLSGWMHSSYYENYEPRGTLYPSAKAVESVMAQLFLVDLFMFLVHKLNHMKLLGGRFYSVSHAPHHKHKTPRIFDAFDGSAVDTTTMIIFPLIITSRIVHASPLEYAAFGSLYSTMLLLLHSSSPHPLERTRVWKICMLGTSTDHQKHHKKTNTNFGHIFRIWDMAMRTT